MKQELKLVLRPVLKLALKVIKHTEISAKAGAEADRKAGGTSYFDAICLLSWGNFALLLKQGIGMKF